MNNQIQKVCKHEPGKKWENGCCSPNPALVPNSYKDRLETLLDWCKIIRDCLDAEQIEDAKFFLEQAIDEVVRDNLTRKAEDRRHLGEGINPFY